MCKIIVRVPTDQYAFVEPTFESIDKYVEEYPRFIRAFLEMQETVKKIKAELISKTIIQDNS